MSMIAFSHAKIEIAQLEIAAAQANLKSAMRRQTDPDAAVNVNAAMDALERAAAALTIETKGTDA